MKSFLLAASAFVAPCWALPACSGQQTTKGLCSTEEEATCESRYAQQSGRLIQCGLSSGGQCLTVGPFCEEVETATCLGHYKKGSKTDGVYKVTVKDLAGKTSTKEVFCDMKNGGWTLIGQLQGWHEIYDEWLRKEHNVDQLKTPKITSNSWASLPAVDMAVNHATDIRFSNEDRSKWVKWALDSERKVTTLWKQSAGRTAINGSPNHPVKVYDQDGGSSNCNQNEYGIMDWSSHGGAYPAATTNDAGNTRPGDDCMAIGVMLGKSANGFSHRQGGNGFDAPESNSDWPNGDYNSAPMVNVWLK